MRFVKNEKGLNYRSIPQLSIIRNLIIVTISRLIISSKDPSDPMEGAATMLLFKLARELNPRGTRGGVFSR